MYIQKELYIKSKAGKTKFNKMIFDTFVQTFANETTKFEDFSTGQSNFYSFTLLLREPFLFFEKQV